MEEQDSHTQLPLKDTKKTSNQDLGFFFFIRLGNIIYFIKINLVTRGMLKAIYSLFTG